MYTNQLSKNILIQIETSIFFLITSPVVAESITAVRECFTYSKESFKTSEFKFLD